jgi:flavin reductase (DIM6/NTAB) family NADH-FMN oxidoreductase RutF
MQSYSSDELTIKEQNKILIGAIGPRPIALISSQSDEEVVNVAPFSYFNIISYRPAIVSVSVQRINGKMKDTARNIISNKEAVVHIVDEDNVALANQTSRHLPAEDSELNYANFTTVKSSVVKPPGLEEAKVRFETSLYNHTEIYNEDEVTADVLMLRIETFHLAKEIYDKDTGYIDVRKLAAVGRLAGQDYAKIGEFFSIERP